MSGQPLRDRSDREHYSAAEIALQLDETLAEVAREPNTNFWSSFWDRLTHGGPVPQRNPEVAGDD